MAKQKAPNSLDPFTQWAHKSGRIFMIIFTVYMVAMPFIVCAFYKCTPSFKMCLPGLLSILVIMAPMSVAEIGSYTPILGSSSYLTFASGNLMNLKMPCIINAQKIAKVEQSTVEGDAIALIATAVSSSVTPTQSVPFATESRMSPEPDSSRPFRFCAKLRSVVSCGASRAQSMVRRPV